MSFMRLLLRRAALAALFVCSVCNAQTAKQFMVAAAHPLAADAGYSVLKLGGSAVDAAIAVQMVLGLVEPESSGIGGGAFMLHWDRKLRLLQTYDGRETAPASTPPERFLDSSGKPLEFMDAVVGGRSVGVPGVLAMLQFAHRRHGKLPWSELFQYAAFAAEEGFLMTPRLHAALEREQHLRSDPSAAKIYYQADGTPKLVGTRIVNAAYGATMRTLALRGAEAFYHGEIAADIVRAVNSHAKPGGVTEQDIRTYHAREREPVCGQYVNHRVCSMGPPSSGGLAVLQILGMLERAEFELAAPRSADAVHVFSEAARLAFADRAVYVADPDFTAVPVERLLSRPYLAARAELIRENSMRFATPGDLEANGTSHFSIVDAQGNAVSMTTTIESPFGSRIMVRGFLLNNQLTDFDFMPGQPNSPYSRKRPRSSMAPTMVFRGGELVMAVGSPGGPNIISYVAKTLVGTLQWKMDIQAAIAMPNFGARNGPTLLEKGTFLEGLQPALEGRQHVLEVVPLQSGLHGIERIPGGWRGGADPRRGGVVRGD
jgi:gamma-glutamyltranspeptidase/glutathione hydrolase